MNREKLKDTIKRCSHEIIPLGTDTIGLSVAHNLNIPGKHKWFWKGCVSVACFVGGSYVGEKLADYADTMIDAAFDFADNVKAIWNQLKDAWDDEEDDE